MANKLTHVVFVKIAKKPEHTTPLEEHPQTKNDAGYVIVVCVVMYKLGKEK